MKFAKARLHVWRPRDTEIGIGAKTSSSVLELPVVPGHAHILGNLLTQAKEPAAMDFLKSAVASAISKGPAFGYSFGDRVDIDDSIWTLHNGTKRVWSMLCFSILGAANLCLLGRWLKVQHILV